MIVLSHLLTINGRPGFWSRDSSRKEARLEENKQRRGGYVVRKTLSPWGFTQEEVKRQRGGLLKAPSPSSLDLGSKAGPAV